jgi:hypothetical protein
MLTDDTARSEVKFGWVGGGDIGPRLSRADLAAAMLKQVDDATQIGQAPAISN